MSAKRFSWRIAVFASALALLTTACSQTDQPVDPTEAGAELPAVFTPVLVSSVGVETAPVESRDGTWRVVYEVILTNAQRAPADIDTIDVVDASNTDTTVATISGDDLLTQMRQLSGGPVEDTSLEPNESMMAFMDLTFDSLDDVPDAVAHRLIGAGAANPGTPEATPMDYLTTPFTLRDRTEVVMGAPLEGGEWVAVNGLEGSGVHRQAVQSVGGQLFNAQRFAIDWMLLDENDTFATNDTSKVENWHSYDQPVLAVADAEVIEVLDELPDQAPGTLPDPAEMTMENVDGNHVILELGDGVYAFYAHLKQGSITVSEGDTVQAGDEIGRLGNSGNTSAPHLHMHVMTTGSALGADSIPYTFEEFTFEGQLDFEDWMTAEDIEGPWTLNRDGQGESHSNELPLDLDVVSFP